MTRLQVDFKLVLGEDKTFETSRTHLAQKSPRNDLT